MKLTLGELKQILVNEDIVSGIPEWELRTDTQNFVDVIRQRMKAFVYLNRGKNGVEKAEAAQAMNDVCDDLERKLYAVLEDDLIAFMRSC